MRLNILICVMLYSVITLFAQTTFTVGDVFTNPGMDFDFYDVNIAINASADGDTIIVFPGVYMHMPLIDFGGKNVYVTSRYKYTGDRNDIYSTILNGFQRSCVVRFMSNETRNAVLNGFTITGGTGYTGNPPIPGSTSIGGGIVISNASPSILNCIISNNQADSGGGIYISASVIGNPINPLLAGNIIKENTSTSNGGGIFLASQSNTTITFDQINKNSIFYNNAVLGKDIYSMGWDYIDVVIDTFTVATDDPYYIYMLGDYDFTCDHWKINQINQNVYVSPTGNDSNDGLSIDSPFKTIAYAMQQIHSYSLAPKTIFLLPGIYRASEGQVFPFFIKPDVILQGAGYDATIFDMEQNAGAIRSTANGRNFRISGIGFINNIGNHQSIYTINNAAPILLLSLHNSEISDCSFENNLFGIQTSDFSSVSNTQSAYFSNLVFKNNFSMGLDLALGNAVLENIKIINNMPYVVNSIYLTLTPIRLRGHGNRASYSFSNILISDTNCNYLVQGPDFGVYESQRPTAMIVGDNIDVLLNNATIVNNRIINKVEPILFHGIIRLGRNSNLEMFNSICYNNVPNYIYGGGIPQSNVYIDHSDFEGGSGGVITSTSLSLQWGEGNIDDWPEFDWDYFGQEDWPYQLMASSPCIDSGSLYIPNYIWLPVDLLGNTRIVGDTVDMGAYEFHGSSDFYVDFEGSPRTGNIPLTVQFTDTSVGVNSTSWQWDFQNDGIIDSTEQNPSFTYYTTGQTTVRLVVNNGQGSRVKPEYINPRPVAITGGSLQGVVTSGGYPISDVLVSVVGTTLSATTNVMGAYTIADIVAGTYSIRAEKIDYETFTHNGVVISVGETTTQHFVLSPLSESDNTIVPQETKLKSNYPNPFNPETTIAFSLATAGNVEIEIYNIKGSKVKTLVNEFRGVGNHHIIWDGTDDRNHFVGSGVYFYRLKIGEYISTRKMLLIK